MSDDDDIEKLLAEIGSPGSSSGKAQVPAVRGDQGSEAARSGRFGRALRTGLVAGVVCGVGVGFATFVFGILPLVDNPWSSGAGAFVGAFLTGATLTATRKG